ncbi:MAG: hypothetical protein KatS3mg102_2268 [Planctomycetota bacterium]|nr:MAG: hypothetical protein KatS3mg102_2268 [Planctomycetota bacterium]
MPVRVEDRQSAVPVDIALLAGAAEATLRAEGAQDLEVSVVVLSDAELHALNRRHLGHDYPTDVISFPLRAPDDPDPLLGEVCLSAERAREEAEARGLALGEELCRYVVHGCLHLLGWDDRDPRSRRRMHARQEAILRAYLEQTGAGREARPRQRRSP